MDAVSVVSKRNETAIKDVDSRGLRPAFRLSKQRPMRWTRRPLQQRKRRRKVNSWPKNNQTKIVSVENNFNQGKTPAFHS